MANMSMQESRRHIMLNTPHIVRPEGSGLVTFTTDMCAPLKSCKIAFLPIQEGSGDPSPDNVRPISGWNNTNITIAGNNIIPIDYAPVKGQWKPTGGVISHSVYSMGQFSVPGGKLRWTAPLKGVTYIGLMDDIIANGVPTYSVITSTNRVSYTLDNTDNHKYMFMAASSQVVINNKVMVNIGTSTTDYSLPSAITYPIDWTDSAGTIYGGYVDLVRGKIVKTVNKRLLNSFSWNTTYAGSGLFRAASEVVFVKTGEIPDVFACEAFKPSGATTASQTGRVPDLGFACRSNTGDIYFRDERYTTLTDFLNAYGEISIAYSLQEKYYTEYDIGPVTLKTLRGINNIWSDANGNIDLSYWTH